MTTSPIEGRVKGLDLEGLLNTLQGDPFSTRKQLPRTPESLSEFEHVHFVFVFFGLVCG